MTCNLPAEYAGMLSDGGRLEPVGTGSIYNAKSVARPPLFDATGAPSSGPGGCVVEPCFGVVKCPLPYVANKPTAPCEYEYVTVKCKKKPEEACGAVRQPCQQKRCCAPERRTHCYTLPPKRPDCYPQIPRPYDPLLFIDAFDTFKPGQKEKHMWNFFSDGEGFCASDGKWKTGRNGLTVNAKRFTKTFPEDSDDVHQLGYLDHIKTFFILNSEFEVPQCGEVYGEAWMSARIFGADAPCVCESPPDGFGKFVVDPSSDLRLGYADFSMLDFDSGVHLGFAVTNAAIYALYEQWPFNGDDGCGEPRANFAAAYYVGGRNVKEPMCDFARLGLAVDRVRGGLWYLNNNLVHQQVRLGTLPDPKHTLYRTCGGSASEVTVKCVRIGFGLFTMLDAFAPNNPEYSVISGGRGGRKGSICGDMCASSSSASDERQVALVRLSSTAYYAPLRPTSRPLFVYSDCNPRRNRLFGQGAVMQLRQVKVENRC